MICDLKRLQKIEPSWSELLMKRLLCIEKEEELEDEVADWSAKTTGNGHMKFIALS